MWFKRQQYLVKRGLSIAILMSPMFMLSGCGNWFSSINWDFWANATQKAGWGLGGKVSGTIKSEYLSQFNAADAAENFVDQNTAISGRSGNVTVTIKDASTGAILGQSAFAYTLGSGNQLVLNNPASATQWVRSFSGYGGDVTIDAQTQISQSNPPPGTTATVTGTVVYGGTEVASGTVTHFVCVTPSDPRCRYN